MKHSIPAGDGEVLFHPSRGEVPQLIASNHTLFTRYDFEVADISFRVLRAAARRRVAAQRGRPVRADLRIVVGAHQPGFHGPGILYKRAVLQRLSRDNLCVNFVVDSDVCGDVLVKIPYRRGRSVGLKEVVVLPNPDGVAFETLRVPPKKEVDLRYSEVEELLESVGRRGMLSAFRRFRSLHERVYREGVSAAAVLTDYQRAYYPTPGVHDDFISAISQTREFLVYACDIMKKIEKFRVVYNSSLREHRQLHRIRSQVNPFPELRGEGGLYELPFWSLDDAGRRRRALAGGEGRDRFMIAEGGERTSPIEPERLLWLRIRPRAVTLTMFLRLFVGDLFVHGVGGGNYDQVTDRIIRVYYGVTPPGYIVCSRTKFLSGDRTAKLKRRAAELRQTLRQMEHNPEKFASGDEALAEEALQILSRSGGRFSAEQHRRVREIRGALWERMRPQRTSVEKEIAETEELLVREAALNRRDFPYFLYSRSQL